MVVHEQATSQSPSGGWHPYGISKDIYPSMMYFMVIQLLGLILISTFPMIASWLPGYFDAQAAAAMAN